jgi:hypothetical protein
MTAQRSPVLLQGTSNDPGTFADIKDAARDHASRSSLSPDFPEYRNHFLAELIAVRRRIKTQQLPIDTDAKHRSGFLPSDS